jgi:hypothetical protein
MYNHAIMLRLICPLLLLLPALTFAEDRSTWQNLTQLQAGDTVRLSLKSRGAVTGTYHEWTPEQVTVGSTTAKREDVTKLERYRKGAWGRGKTAGMGALIGGGAGAGCEAARPSGRHGARPVVALRSERCDQNLKRSESWRLRTSLFLPVIFMKLVRLVGSVPTPFQFG